jgi:hypothetical protein
MQPKPEDYRTYFAGTFKDHRVVIEGLHSHFSPEHMGQQKAADFD